MPERPILILPRPEKIEPPKGRPPISNLKLPSRSRQVSRFAALFDRLRDVLGRASDRIELRDDPSSLAPDRVLVFEIAGTVQNFVRAISKIDGLEFMAELETEFAGDDDFSLPDTRKGKEGQVRTDKSIPARLYLAMPNTDALAQIVRLWQQWQRGENLGTGYTPFEHVFAQLHDLRPWGPQDRVPPETLRYWREEIALQPDKQVRTEVELWFHRSETLQQRASTKLREHITAIGGTIIDEAVIPEIAYHGALINVPRARLPNSWRAISCGLPWPMRSCSFGPRVF